MKKSTKLPAGKKIISRYSQNILEEMVNFLPDVIYRLSRTGKIDFLSLEFEKLTGWKRDEWIGRKFSDILHPDDRKYAQQKFDEGMEGRELPPFKFRVKKKGGGYITVEFKSRAKAVNGKMVGKMGIAREVSFRGKDEETLMKIRSIVESSDDAIFSKSLTGIITSWNKGAEIVYGYKDHEAVGKHISILVPPNKKRELGMIMQKLNMGEKIAHLETERVRKDGKLIFVSMTVSPIKDLYDRLTGGAVIGRDITERKILEKRKDEFISIASHELKTPLTSIKAFTQLLKHRLSDAGEEEATYYLNKMETQIERMNYLISGLLDLTKMRAGMFTFKEDIYFFDDIVDETIELIQKSNNKHKIIKRGKAHKYITIDKFRFTQVLSNILTNAIKYSPRAKKIIVVISADRKDITLSVRDFGMGIPKEKKAKVFDRYFRVNGDRMEIPGLGLGLFISREIVNRFGGKIWVESKLNRGSTFYFTVPLRRQIKDDGSGANLKYE